MNHVKTCSYGCQICQIWVFWGLCVFKDFDKEYFKKFEINKNQNEAATKEVFCDKDVLKLLAISLKIIYCFIVSFIGDFSVRNYMHISLMAATEITAIFTHVHLHFKFLKQTI